MNYFEFRKHFFDLACFTNVQVLNWNPGFDRTNLTRWIQKGYLIRLRQGYYTFPEYLTKPDFPYFFANQIYRPSYVSLHTALAFYGMIPESVVQFTSVTSLKTAGFANAIGEYSYQTVKESLMFGYTLKPIGDGRTIKIALPEKALLDLLYLYPEYNTKEELEYLRIDPDFLHDDLNRELLNDFTRRFGSKALEHKVSLFLSLDY